MSKRIKPNIVRGGVSIPLGDNTFLLKGRTHEQGGIDIGSNPSTGVEAEDGEVVKIGKDLKIYSAQPILNGESPASKVIRGEPKDKVFEQQENFKDKNGLNDDGTKIKTNMNKKYRKAKLGIDTSKISTTPIVNLDGINHTDRFTGVSAPTTASTSSINPSSLLPDTTKPTSFGMMDYLNLGSVGANILGSVGSYFINKNAIDDIRANAPDEMITAPVNITPAKLKTQINVNPQLKSMKDQASKYSDAIFDNTKDSRTALSRVRGVMDDTLNRTNALYADKENTETQLQNQNAMNEQTVNAQNIAAYNRYKDAKVDQENTLTNWENEMRARSSSTGVNLLSGLNTSLQDFADIYRQYERDDNTNRLLDSTYGNVDHTKYTKRLGGGKRFVKRVKKN